MLDLAAARRGTFVPTLLLAGGGLIVLSALLWLVGGDGPAILLLALTMVAGYGATYLCGLPLTVEERLAYGAVVGSMVATLAGFAFALLIGFGLLSVLAGLVVSAALGAAGLVMQRPQAMTDLADLRARWGRSLSRQGHPWPLLLVLLICWAFTIRLLAQAYSYTPQGLVVGSNGIYADWAAHLTYAGSFAYGGNLPPEFPIDPGHRLTYPFMIDFLAASLVPLGTSLTSALVLTSGFLGLAFPAVMYLAAQRLVGGRLAPALSVFVFVLAGGLGFMYLLGDIDAHGLDAILHPPRQYTLNMGLNYQWYDIVLAQMLPQRSSLCGYAVALIAAAVLWLGIDRRGWRPFLFAGVLVGLTPLFHLHGFGTAVALGGFWALINRRREWIAFFAPALLLGLPAAAWMATGGASSLRWEVGWMAGDHAHPENWPWFWLKNLGVFIPLLVLAQFWRPGGAHARFALHFAPLWLWFLVPNLIVFQPWDWDNTKFFAFWALFGSILIGTLLAAIAARSALGIALAAVCVLVIGLGGALDLERNADARLSGSTFTDAAGVDIAQWARTHTDAHSIFLVAPIHNHPIPTLAGRRVVVGYAGWTWSYGLADANQRELDVGRMLRGEPGTATLLKRYNVKYVVIGPEELRRQASVAYWDGNADRVFTDGPYVVYATR